MDRRPSMPQRDKGEGGSTFHLLLRVLHYGLGRLPVGAESGKKAVLISKEVDGGGPPAGPFIRP